MLRHIKEVHPHFQSAVVCGLEGCVATPSSFQALRTHLYRKHRRLLDCVTEDVTPEIETTPTPQDEMTPANEEWQEELHNEQDELPPAPKSALLGAEYIMKIRDGKGLTQTATDGILQDTTIVVQNTLESVKETLLKKLGDLPLPLAEDQVSDLMSVFSDESVQEPFRGLESVYKQDKFIREHFNYVVSLIRWNHCRSHL